MIIFDGSELKIGEVKKNGEIASRSESLQISLLEHFNDKVLIKEGTSLQNLIWGFLNDENSEELSASLNYLTKGNSFFEHLRNELEKGTKSEFESAEWIELISKPVLLESAEESYLTEKYEENWGLLAWSKNESEKEDLKNISSLSINSLLTLPVRQNFDIQVYDEDWNKVGQFKDLPSVADLLEAFCYEFYLIRNSDDPDLDHYSDNNSFKSFTELI